MILTYLSSKTLYYKFWLPIWLKEPFYRPHYNIIIVFLKFAAQVTPRCSSILNYTRCGNWVTRIFSIIFCYNTNIMCHLGIENLQLQTHNPLKYCSWVVKMWSARAFFLSVAKKWVTWDLNKGSAAHPRREGAKVFSLGRRLPLKKKKTLNNKHLPRSVKIFHGFSVFCDDFVLAKSSHWISGKTRQILVLVNPCAALIWLHATFSLFPRRSFTSKAHFEDISAVQKAIAVFLKAYLWIL